MLTSKEKKGEEAVGDAETSDRLSELELSGGGVGTKLRWICGS
jgi:hypothetical protein